MYQRYNVLAIAEMHKHRTATAAQHTAQPRLGRNAAQLCAIGLGRAVIGHRHFADADDRADHDKIACDVTGDRVRRHPVRPADIQASRPRSRSYITLP